MDAVAFETGTILANNVVRLHFPGRKPYGENYVTALLVAQEGFPEPILKMNARVETLRPFRT
jgi:hypothetical protein